MKASARQKAWNGVGRTGIKKPRGRPGPRRRDDGGDSDDTLDGAVFADLIDDLPDDGFDLGACVREMGIASGSNALAMRRRA